MNTVGFCRSISLHNSPTSMSGIFSLLSGTTNGGACTMRYPTATNTARNSTRRRVLKFSHQLNRLGSIIFFTFLATFALSSEGFVMSAFGRRERSSFSPQLWQ